MESKANVQTRATMKYQKKVGIIAKSFKIKKELADNFKKRDDNVAVYWFGVGFRHRKATITVIR